MASSTPTIKATIKVNGVEETHDLQIVIGDMVRYDLIRARNKWPNKDEAQFLFMAVLAYAALLRLGVIPSDMNESKFIDHCILNLELAEDADNTEEPSFQLSDETKALIILSYAKGIPFKDLVDLPNPIISYYLELLEEEAEANERSSRGK